MSTKGILKELEAIANDTVEDYIEEVQSQMQGEINTREGALVDSITTEKIAKNQWKVGVDNDRLVNDSRNKSSFDYSYAYHDGRGEVRPKRASALRFETREGDIVYTKRARATKGHPFVDIVFNNLPKIK